MKRLAYHSMMMVLLLCSNAVQAAWETPSAPTLMLAQQAAAPQPGVTATMREAFYKISVQEVAQTVAGQLEAQGVGKTEVSLNPGTPPVLYSADRQLQTTLHALQIDPASKRWQTQLYIVQDGKTVSVKPISGTFAPLVEMPVLTRQIGRGTAITEADIVVKPVPERLLRSDSISDKTQIIGLTPRSGISPNRPLQASELIQPAVVKRGDLVEMEFSTQYIKIKATGVALEDGAKGASIRVKNQKSERAVSARVVAAGKVTVNTDLSL